MSNLPRQQRGLSLITAIFILVMLALIALFAVRSVGSQQAQNNQALIGLRAEYAARAGLQWGAAQALPPTGSCAATSNLVIEGVAVTVNCVATDVVEAGVPYRVFAIGVLAQSGVLGQPEYAQRSLTGRFSNKL